MCSNGVSSPDLVFDNSVVAKGYSHIRPQPPHAIVQRVIDCWKKDLGEHPTSSHILDVGCGSGQSTVLFTNHFDEVTGIDCSAQMIEEAKERHKHWSNLTFKVGQAEFLDFAENSLDVITVCAAMHWFNLPTFYRQVDRVLRPNGILATYSYVDITPYYGDKSLRATIKKLRDGMGFFSPHHDHLQVEFDSLPPPYQETLFVSSSTKEFEVSIPSDMEGLMTYYASFAPMLKYRSSYGDDAADKYLTLIRKSLMDDIGTGESNPSLYLKYFYFLRIWRKPATN